RTRIVMVGEELEPLARLRKGPMPKDQAIQVLGRRHLEATLISFAIREDARAVFPDLLVADRGLAWGVVAHVGVLGVRRLRIGCGIAREPARLRFGLVRVLFRALGREFRHVRRPEAARRSARRPRRTPSCSRGWSAGPRRPRSRDRSSDSYSGARRRSGVR